MVSSGMLRRVALVRTDVSEELSASFISMTRIGELGTTLAVSSNRRALRRNTKLVQGHIHLSARGIQTGDPPEKNAILFWRLQR
jgi:hypothetical protein